MWIAHLAMCWDPQLNFAIYMILIWTFTAQSELLLYLSLDFHSPIRTVVVSTYSHASWPGFVLKAVNLCLCTHFCQFGKCPKISNTLFHSLLAKILLFMQQFLKLLNGMANSVDPDQTAPSGAVWSGSTLFAYVILSDTSVFEILGHLP